MANNGELFLLYQIVHYQNKSGLQCTILWLNQSGSSTVPGGSIDSANFGLKKKKRKEKNSSNFEVC